MIASLKRQYIYEVSIGLGKEYYDNENDQINDGDASFGAIALSLSPSLHYLTKSVEYPKDRWTKLDRTFGKIDEDHNSRLESTSNTIRVPDPKFQASTLSIEVVQDEKEAKSSFSDFPLNSVQNIRVIASESEEKLDFSPSNLVAGVKICNTLDILEEISDYQSDPFASRDLYLPAKFLQDSMPQNSKF